MRTSTTANCEPHARVKRGRVPRKRQNTQGGGDDEETPVHVDMEEDAVVAVQTVDTQSRRARVPKSLPGRSIEVDPFFIWFASSHPLAVAMLNADLVKLLLAAAWTAISARE